MRAAKLKKLKKDKLPKDSVGIFILKNKKLIKYPDIVSFKLPKEGNSPLALLLKNQENSLPKKDTLSD